MMETTLCNRWDFRYRRNDDRVDAAVTVGGRLFQALVLAAEKDRSPSVDLRVAGTTNADRAGRRTLQATIVTIFSHFVNCLTIFRLFLEFTTNSNFWLSEGSAAISWRNCGEYYMGFVWNLLLFRALKKLWKFVKNWQSYRQSPLLWFTTFLGHSV